MKNTLLVDLFKIDKVKKEMIILKEPFTSNTIIKIDDKKMEEIMIDYYYFKYKENDREAIFAQDLFDETNISYHTRKRFKREYSMYF